MEPWREDLSWRIIYGVAVLAVLGFFLFAVRSVLSPLVLFIALVLLLAPLAGGRIHRMLVLVTSLLLLLWLLTTTGRLLAPFILALVLAYVLDPLVDLLERRRVPRPAGIALLALPLLGAIALLVLFGIPALAGQAQELIEQAPAAIERVVRWVEGARLRLLAMDLPFVREADLLAPLAEFDAARLTGFLVERQRAIMAGVWEAVLGVGKGLGFVLTLLGYLVLTPVLTYYLLRDWDRITHAIHELLPVGQRGAWTDFAREYDGLVSSYLRGQLMVAVVVGILTGTGLALLRFPYAAVVGVVAGVFNLVPYIGLIVSLIPALIIAVLSGNLLLSLLKIAVVFVSVNVLESSVLSPRIVGGSVGLHPVWIILAIAVGGFFFGFVGLLLAVPGAAFLKLVLRIGLERYRRSGVYLGTGAEPQ